jgi:hypothetical protein
LVPLDGYVATVSPNGLSIKRLLSKKEKGKVSVNTEISGKKNKKENKDYVL